MVAGNDFFRNSKGSKVKILQKFNGNRNTMVKFMFYLKKANK